MRFTINIATRTHIDRKLVNRAGYAVLALLLVLLAWNVSRTFWNLGELRRLQADNASYEQRLNSRPGGVSEKDFNGLLADIKFYNEIIARKSYNWLGLLEQLEGATPEGIALSALGLMAISVSGMPEVFVSKCSRAIGFHASGQSFR